MIFLERKFFYGEEGEGKGGISLFSVENMLYHSTERHRKGNFPSVSQSFSGIEKKRLHIRGTGGTITILNQMFCLNVTKPFVEEPFCVSKNSGIGKI